MTKGLNNGLLALIIIKTFKNAMKAFTLLSATALAALMAGETEAKTALADIQEEATAVNFALQQDYGDEYGAEEADEADTEEPVDEEADGSEDTE